MQTVIITSGGTIEHWDDVRGHTNLARGIIGAHIAQCALDAGFSVILLHGYFAATLEQQPNLQQIVFHGVADLSDKLQYHTSACTHPVVVMTAAVADWVVEKITDREGVAFETGTKISSDAEPVVYLTRAPKLLKQIKSWNAQAQVVGFKLESVPTDEELIQRATVRMQQSNVDLMIANRPISLQSNESDHLFVSSDGTHLTTTHSKETTAQAIVQWIQGGNRVFSL
ncbi:MAG: phosphopantothenoylcysteine decarboxylase [Bacilli bacterium]